MPSRSVGTVVTTTYLYDVNDERIALGANGATTTYPFKLYNISGNTIYKHIFANGEPVADVKGSTTTAAVYYIHDDHLGGSSVISDANANVAQVLEYYPWSTIAYGLLAELPGVLDRRRLAALVGVTRR